MKTAISIDNNLFSLGERLAEKLGMSRSRLYSIALKYFVEQHDQKNITAQLDTHYSKNDSILDPFVNDMQSTLFEDENW
ncbi:MAG: ChpI protein [Candidatus Marinimicrobia bacterium]|nr:ChpI protein [Candidatus Neomarinimicrobiota bacterium]